MQCAVVLLVLLLPASLAYRDGADEQSCYDHAVVHSSGFVLPANGQCMGRCLVDFAVVGEVMDIMNPDQVNNVTETLTCNSVYRSKFHLCSNTYI